MRIRYSYRTEMGHLPNATVIMETTRKLHYEFIENPTAFWKKYEEWLRPMNSLNPGHFFSINIGSKEFKFIEYFAQDCVLRLEYMDLGKNYAKVTFEADDSFPYKVASGKYNSNQTSLSHNHFRQKRTCVE